MSGNDALSPIPDDSHSSQSAEADAAAASCATFWPVAVATHADSALDLLAALNLPDHCVAHDTAVSVDRIRANADATCTDDLRNTQQVHHVYAYAEHSSELDVRVAAVDDAVWRLAQFVYES
jgi:hypothetical protein